MELKWMNNTCLDLEREAFLSLVAEPKSQQRMQHMLRKRKTTTKLKD